MPLIRCPSCKNVFSASDASRGAVMPCPSCAQLCRIPAPAASRQPPKEQALSASPPSRTPSPEDEDLEELDEVEDLQEVEPADDSEPDDRPPPRRRRQEIVEEPEDDDEEVSLEVVRPGRRRKRRRGHRPDGNLDRVNLGLGFYYASILALLAGLVVELVAFAAGFTGGVNAVAGSAEGAATGLGMAMLFSIIAMILIDWVAPILGMVGSILCLWAPSASGARGLCIASLALNASATLGSILIRVLMFFVPAGEVIGGVGMIGASLMTFIAWCLFMAFLRQLCLHLGEDTLAGEAIAVMMRGIAILVLAPFAFMFGLLLVFALKCVGLITFLVAMLFGLYGLFLFLRRQLDLIGSIRQVIASRY